MQRLLILLPVLLLLHTTSVIAERPDGNSPAAPPTTAEFPEVLSITQVVDLVSRHNPSLRACSSEVLGREAAIIQAGALPNPQLDAEIENFGGTHSPGSLDVSEVTIGLSQEVELGGKRKKRKRIAVQEKMIAETELLRTERDVRAVALETFIHVLVAQEQVALSTELLLIAEKTASTVTEKVEAGKISPIEKSRAYIELASARSDTIRAMRTLAAARQSLAGLWGDDDARFVRVEGELNCISTPPSKDSLITTLSRNPVLTRWDNEIERQMAILDLQGAAPIPDLSVSAGIRNFRESGDNTFIAGISVPLPLFNRNRGGTGEARHTLDKTRQQRMAAGNDLRSNFSVIWESLSSAYWDALTIRDEILPLATTTYESTELGYREGKFDFMKMLDAQKTYFITRNRFLTSLAGYHLAAIEMERITGIPLHDCIGITSPNHLNKDLQ